MQKRKLDTGKFKYNRNNVCENPDVILNFKGSSVEYKLLLAQCHAGWLIGSELNVIGTHEGAGGNYSLPSMNGGVFFSKQIASLAVAEQALQFFLEDRVVKKKSELEKLKAFIFHLKEDEAPPAAECVVPLPETAEGIDTIINEIAQGNNRERFNTQAPVIINDISKPEMIQHNDGSLEPVPAVQIIPVFNVGCVTDIKPAPNKPKPDVEMPAAAVWFPGGPNDLNEITADNALKYKAMFTWKIPQAQQNFEHFQRILDNKEFHPGLTKAAVEELREHQRVFKIQLEAGMEQVKYILKNKPKTTMAKVKPAATNPAADHKPIYVNVAVTAIDISPTNKLHREDWELNADKDALFADLILSVKQHGVIQPVLLRPGIAKGKYFLVCGERRWTAAQKAGLLEVPATIMELTDEEAFELQIIENLQRKDVHPMKEAESYAAYMEQKKATVEDLAVKFSKTKDYILQRLSFNSLIPELRKDFYSNKMGAGHAALFARLTAADQKLCFDKCKMEQHEASAGQYMLIDDIKEFISVSLMMELKNVPFSLTDATLVPAAGSCAACPKRSGAGLFGDVTEKDRCFDGACFKLKNIAHLVNTVTDLLENNKEMPVIKMGTEATITEVKKLLDKAGVKVARKYWEFDEATKDTKGAVKALCVAGASAGKFFYIKIKKQKATLESSPSAGGGSTDSKPVSIPLAKKIEIAQGVVNNVKEKIEDELVELAVKKLFDFKPYKDVDSKPLTKYETAAFIMAMEDVSGSGPLQKILHNIHIKTKVPGVPATHKNIGVEQYAVQSKEVVNTFIRAFIANYVEDSVDFDEDAKYLVLKLAEENQAIKMQELKATAEKKFKVELAAAELKLQELKTPPVAKPKPTPEKITPAKKVTKKAAVKKATSKK